MTKLPPIDPNPDATVAAVREQVRARAEATSYRRLATVTGIHQAALQRFGSGTMIEPRYTMLQHLRAGLRKR